MRFFVSTAAAAFGVALAAPAFAQDVNPVFTGPRVEAILGYDNVGAGSSGDIDNNDQSADGLLYGIGVGYDFAAGGALVGIEGEFTDSTGKTERGSDPEFFGFGRVGVGRDLYIGARAGILATPSTLIYAKGGYTNARLDILARNSSDETRRDFNLDGWRLGAGAEQAIGRNTFAKLEYRYSNYNDGNITVDGDTVSRTFDVDTDRHQVVASVGLRF